MSSRALVVPSDQSERDRALNPARSVLVRAPAGSGKTDLLTRRFLRLLAEVDDPAQIVAITFTRAAAAEMRHRILSEIEKAAAAANQADASSMQSLASRVVDRSRARGWNLLDLPAQLRISTIDSFCREIAVQRPLLSTLGGSLEVSEEPDALYRRAARATLDQIGNPAHLALSQAIEDLLLWRDNNWQELEDHLVKMLASRDRWMQEFWLDGFAQDDESRWDQLRRTLEQPFARAVTAAMAELIRLLQTIPGACEEAHLLARFACRNTSGALHTPLAELAELPCGPFATADDIDAARQAHLCLADLLQKSDGEYRKQVNKNHGFPQGSDREKHRLQALIQSLRQIPGLQSALHGVRTLPPTRYTDDDWRIVRASFTLLRHATAQLQVAFAEAGTADFIEVAHAALHLLEDETGQPTEAAFAIADKIRHLLVDEFQDTSRRQHRLLSALVRAWPEQEGHTLFVVGDPMQSIYFFRNADAELFPRVESLGLELQGAPPLPLDSVRLAANFRTAPELVHWLNTTFNAVFSTDDGSGIRFSPSQPARPPVPGTPFALHLDFVPQVPRGKSVTTDSQRAGQDATDAHDSQTEEIVALIRSHQQRIEAARARGETWRIAVLGRSRKILAHIAAALRNANIPFRAVDLEPLADRPEVLDALSLARALFHPEDRVAWLGVLRAPWCALSLHDLHTLVSADEPSLLQRPIPSLLSERLDLLSPEGRAGVERVLQALVAASALRSTLPTASLGTWLEQVWLRLGGDACVDAPQRVNLNLLWSCIDKLSGGEPDLLGSALDVALEKLTAQPDPASSGECGVQLMTIHKAKGLEFEVVIVPELQARSGRTRPSMFSWLERGLAEHDPPEEITEFLVAPFQTRGAEKGQAKHWVDSQYSAREKQETRRLLYVAATRAREELHIFARPAYKIENGAPTLCNPEGLLATAWPALEEEVNARFARWQLTPQQEEVLAIAAAADVIEMPAPPKPALLRRLPLDFTPPAPPPSSTAAEIAGSGTTDQLRRHEGGMLSRALGIAVHALFEELARLRTTCDSTAACEKLAAFAPRIAARVRETGVSSSHAESLAAQALEIAARAASDPVASWILSPHPDAASEARWAGVIDGDLRTVQVDRVFRAGMHPIESGENSWWIVDWKTIQAGNIDPRSLRALFAPQIDLYAQVLRKLHGPATQIRGGLYYPRMLQFDWWEL